MDFWSTEFNLLICVKRTGYILADRFCPGELQGQRSGRKKEEVQPAADFQLRFWSDVWAFVSRPDLLPGISQNSLFLKPMCSGSDEASLPVLKLFFSLKQSDGNAAIAPKVRSSLRLSAKLNCGIPSPPSPVNNLVLFLCWGFCWFCSSGISSNGSVQSASC